jgi:hypothetical protein
MVDDPGSQGKHHPGPGERQQGCLGESPGLAYLTVCQEGRDQPQQDKDQTVAQDGQFCHRSHKPAQEAACFCKAGFQRMDIFS